jgi:scyllo-inositol 2-dehydrogenase (NADP+)
MSPIRTAVLGFGTSGRVFHAPLLAANPDFEVAAIVTSDPDRAAAAAAEYPGARIVPTAAELLADTADLDLVVVGTPNTTHAPIAHAAIDRGLHVVLDKPVAVTVAEAEGVVDAARTAGLTLSVFQNRRWDGDFLTLRAAIDRGDLGEVRQLDTAFDWFSPVLTSRWKDTATPAEGGGMLYDLGPHLIDQAIQLFGPVAEIHAELDTRRDGGGADDDAFATLQHESGVRTRLWASSIAPAPRQRFRAVGSTAVLSFDGLDPQEPQLISGLRPGDSGYGLHSDGRTATLAGPDGTRQLDILPGDYPEYYRRLAAAIHDGAPVPVDPADSIEALRLIERARSPR